RRRHTRCLSDWSSDVCSSDLDIMPVFFALQIVLNENQPLIRSATDPVKFPVGATFLNWRDFYLTDIQTRKMHSRLSKKQGCSHRSEERRVGKECRASWLLDRT